MAKTMGSRGGGKSRKKANKLKGRVAERIDTTGSKARAEAAADNEHREHNLKARKDIIREACRWLEKKEAERDAITTEIRNYKNEKIKGVLGMKIGDFDAARRVYSLDSEDRAVYLETMAESFKALGVGEQLDFLNVAAEADRKVVAKTEAERTAALKIAGQEGFEAGKAGKFPIANPHPSNTDEHAEWEKGRLRGQEKLAMKLGGAEGAAAGNA